MALILRPPGSREALQDRLSELGRTRKRFALAAALFAFVASVVAATAVAGAIDAAFHLPPLARGFALVFILTLGGVLWVRGVMRAASLRTDPLAVALELEERYPSLNDAVASAVTFLATDAGDRGVSNRLQSAVVRSAQRLVDRHEFGRIIPTHECWRAGWTCAIVLAAMLPLALVNVGRAGLTLVRLADPFGAHPWPTKTRIVILTPETFPTRLPKGEPFAFRFSIRGVIPDHATVVVRLVGASEDFSESYLLANGPDATEATVAAQIDPGRLPGPFTFRVLANDGDTGWQQVDVAPPPRLIDLEGRPSPQIHLTPPAYTGLPAVEAPDAAAVVEIPAGTLLRLRAAADRRLATARLAYQGDKSIVEKASAVALFGHMNPLAAALAGPVARSIAGDIPMTLDSEARTMSAAFVPAMSGMYALQMTDETGLIGSRLLEIRNLPDPSPMVALVRPALGRDPMVYALDAVISFQISADDKVYALRSVFLEYQVGPDGRVRTIPLLDVRDAVRALPAVAGGLGVARRIPPIDAEVTAALPVSAFRREDGTPVRDGDTLFVVAAADDWDDVSVAKPPGRSGVLEIRIAASDAIEAWVQRELAAMRPDLVHLRDQQREAREKTAETVPLPDGGLTPTDRDRLLTAEQEQRQIRGKVSDPIDGLRAKADVLRETVRANKLPASNTTRRVDAVADEIGRIADRELGTIEVNLGDARQLGGQPVRPGQEQVAPEHLKKAARRQQAVEDGLTNLLDVLAVWGGATEIRGEARVLRDQLARQVGEGEKLGEKVPAGKPAAALSPSQRADLERAGGRADLTAEQAGGILTRAARLASEKDKQAAEERAAVELKKKLAADLRARAEAQPAGSPQRAKLDKVADATQAEADVLKDAASKAAAEAAALRAAIEAASGQALTDDLRTAAEALRNNRQAEAAARQRSAAGRLDKLGEALTEKPTEMAPELRKKQKPLGDELNELSDAQADLRKRAAAAAKAPDPANREAAIKRLAVEEQKLIEKGRDLLQKLNRTQADEAARETREALDHMESARDDLERGKPASRAQDDAVEKLDGARDQIDAATTTDGQQLSEEKRRKMAERVKALVDRQRAAVKEADRIHGLVTANKKWERPLLASYADLEEREKTLATEVKQLADKEFAPLPVLARLLTESSAAMESTADKAKIRREDALDADPAAAFDPDLEAANDRRVKRPAALALRRLEQLLAVLKEDPPKKKAQPPGGEPPSAPPMPGGAGGADGGGDADIIPPLAQLKVLESLQAELNQRTAEFDQAHPDRAKLTDEEQAEIKEIEQAQREMATLFEQLAKLFRQEKAP